MKALQITRAGQYRIIEQAIPEVKNNEILVKIEIVSTCPRWDINMMAGKDMFDYSRSPEYPLPPGFPGHETAGFVHAIGSDVSGFAVGDRVAALEHIPHTGSYMEYMCYKEHELLRLPDQVTFEQAVSFELVKCVMIGMSQFADMRGKRVVISGLGPAGILAMQLAAIWGASEVVGLDVNEKRIEYVRQLKIGEVQHVDKLGDRRFDYGYDCVGLAQSVNNLLRQVDEHVVIFGVLRGTVQFEERLWLKGMRLEAYQYRPFTARDRELLIDAVAHKGLNTACIQTHCLPLSQYDQAIHLLNNQEAIKVYFYPGKEW
ncbi:alcohol dehydrogenase catalytic domain-containing protein [Paenibacillus sp. HWE-109]|uniref:zinc-dependent alcohol dehydrogenase n=1 Tax=Paenibacillus sp. HWE-109 TaxID=1306526 RepID=UPI001EDDC58D|nr:zinc-binding dehydrogenase [Paenibacillus sp. HWE-109]UKS27953.1 alcohol dehydrogenase catalytic domain-containing protein [Paenibacillus sp. HWE-109]